MKVLILSETLWPYGSGGELATYLYAKFLKKYGVEVKIIIKSNKSSEFWKDIYVYGIDVFGYGKYFVLHPRSKAFIKEFVEWGDVVYFTGLFNLIPFVKSLGRPVVVHIHSYFPLCPVGHLYNFVYNKVCNPNIRSCSRCIWIYESTRRDFIGALLSTLLNSVFKGHFLNHVLKADALIFVSQEQRKLFSNYIKGLYGDVEHLVARSYVIYNPIPMLRYVPIKGDDIGFLGGLDPIKGWKVLFDAWEKVFRKHGNARLRATMTLSLPSSVDSFNVVRYPRLTGVSLEKFYEHVRAVVVPSICPEPSPYVVVEALLRGRLLIASRVGGIPEIVGEAPGVRLVPPGDVGALADALDWALSMDRRDVVELGLKNREYVLKRFDNERSVRELIRVFERVLNG